MNSLLERFLRYSLSYQRPIKVMLMRESVPQNQNLTVQSMDQEGFTYLIAKNKKQAKYLRYEDVLAAAYARGDSGEGTQTKDTK